MLKFPDYFLHCTRAAFCRALASASLVVAGLRLRLHAVRDLGLVLVSSFAGAFSSAIPACTSGAFSVNLSGSTSTATSNNLNRKFCISRIMLRASSGSTSSSMGGRFDQYLQSSIMIWFSSSGLDSSEASLNPENEPRILRRISTQFGSSSGSASAISAASISALFFSAATSSGSVQSTSCTSATFKSI